MHWPQWKLGRRLSVVCAAGIALTGLVTVSSFVQTVADAPSAAAATYVGSAARLILSHPIVDMASTPTGGGYWLVASDGGIFSYGDAHFYGSTGGRRLNRPIVGMTATKSGHGYWLVASDGGIFTFGDAHYRGSTGGIHLNKPIVGMATTPGGNGYWLVASDGGIFTFGDARYRGSTGSIHLNKPIIGMAPTASGQGYWLSASDGGIFTFGDAHYHGSTGGRRLAEPIVGMAAAHNGAGYWLVGADGGIFNFGTARFYGSAAGALAGQRAVGVDASARNDGYWVASQWGGVDTASPSGMRMDPNLVPRRGEDAIAVEMVQRINVERATRGLHALYVDPTLKLFAVNWAHYLGQTGRFEHQNLAKVFTAAPGKFGEVGEDLFKGSGGSALDAGTAHVALMHSDGHRANILLPEHQAIGVGAACINGFLVVDEVYAAKAGTPLPNRPTPPLNPIAASNEGGSHC